MNYMEDDGGLVHGVRGDLPSSVTDCGAGTVEALDLHEVGRPRTCVPCQHANPSEHEVKLCQLAAEALWNATTSDEHRIASYRSPVYAALQRAFDATLREVYGLKAARVNQVNDLLCEYGPNDSLSGTRARGVASYVEFALAHSTRERF
jgi:sulfur transfer protein SufE